MNRVREYAIPGGGDAARLRVVPANEASWDDLQSILTGSARRCQCQRQRLGDHDWFRIPPEARADLLREETHCDDPRASETIGVVGYLDDEPVAWAAVDERGVYGRVRGSPVPWAERDEDKDDPRVWAIPCLVVRKGYRQRALTYPLVAGAIDHARGRGAAAVEAYPLITGGAKIAWDELSVGPVGPFLAAGMHEVTHPTKRRLVMRIDF